MSRSRLALTPQSTTHLVIGADLPISNVKIRRRFLSGGQAGWDLSPAVRLLDLDQRRHDRRPGIYGRAGVAASLKSLNDKARSSGMIPIRKSRTMSQRVRARTTMRMRRISKHEGIEATSDSRTERHQTLRTLRTLDCDEWTPLTTHEWWHRQARSIVGACEHRR